MQLTTVFLATLACATGAFANLHAYAWCQDQGFEGINETAKENNAATAAACAAYKNRNTGTKQWDTCPDCSPGFRGDVRVCNSPAKHIGGDEWNYYCRKAGASYGRAD
ncbi:hypothetical protein K504DRAFT_452414 [Pleomassaria siparia CBS 279.74]|uniref:Uncharacterized protein n=1 Tax=Pleomassaria siparia CBS 279.74 TaxID=1314801 RepID=A0A6G1KH05_9PLEO|nr:hypothetical protein K504DRAFT_452414 [Pleomassaria siparia CBS 279.74]